MAQEEASAAAEPVHTEETVVVKRPLWQRILKWLLIAVVGIVVLLGLIVAGLNTSPGRRFVADRLSNFTTASGLNVKVGRIDGSLYGAMTLKDVRVYDTQGVWLTSPSIALDWRPFDYIHNHVDVRSLTSPLITVARAPVLKPSTEPTPPNQPLLPDIDIDVNRLAIDRLVVGAPITGAKRVLKITGQAHIADRRAQVQADAVALTERGVRGGDKLHLVLDAVPDANRLNIDAKLFAPANGVVAGFTNTKAPLIVDIGGQGSWASWSGKAQATLGGKSLADLALTARNGTFGVRGSTHPGLYMQGPVERLTQPGLDVAIDAALDQRRVNTQFQLRSSALAVDGRGLIDLAQSQFGGFHVDARLLTPGAIAPNLAGRDVAASVTLDGPFATPTVQYVVRANQIAFGTTGVRGLYATGTARVNSDRILVPVQARAAAVTGLNAAVGGLLQNVTINGDFAIAGTKILSDNLKIRSRQIDATAIIVADLSSGVYRGALKGRINNYRIESIGIVNLSTDAHLVTAPGGGFGITGHVVAQTQQIFNNGARTFLGGNATVAADIGYDPNGIVSFRNLRLNAPKFRVTRGEGRFNPANGQVLVNADAYSTQYGPLSVRVTGTATDPDVDLTATRPNFGIGLANLRAHVRGRNGSYAVTATGDTNYGPFSADVVVTPGNRLTVQVNRLLFAGITAEGRIAQTASGVFAGALQFSGSGLQGTVTLADQGGVQRADVAARGFNARIPGASGFTIGRLIVNATAILYPNGPQVTADAQVANLRYGGFVLSAARAKVNYRNGSGTAQAVAQGSSGVPFRIALNAQLSPNAYLVALRGQANGINFRTANPARIEATGGAYKLLPTRIDFDKGSLRLAGSYGNGMALQARLDRLDLSVLNATAPSLGLGGTATGSIDFAQPNASAFPQADVRLTINNFTRSSIAAVSEPVDLVFVGRLLADGGEGRALIRRNNTVVGRMVVNLRPLPPGTGSWVERLMQAPLGGGIRYNGPASTLFSFAALADQQLSGPIAVGADFSGRVRAPQLTGVVRASNLTYANETYGTKLTNMQLAGRFTSDRFELSQLQAKAGDGTVSASGFVNLAADQGFPLRIQVQMNNAQLAKSDALGASATGNLTITNDPKTGALIQGKLSIPDARYQIIRQGQAEVPELTGVHRKGDVAANPDDQPKSAARAPSTFKLDIDIDAPNQIFVSGMGLESEWELHLHIGGTSANPEVRGRLQVIRGTYSFAGKRFELNRGIVTFEGAALSDPTLNLQATTTTNGITAVINITGTGQHPQIEFTSTPALPQDEVLSRLLFGTNPSNLSATEALQLAAALNSLRGSGGGGINPLGKLRSATGFDRLRVLGADQASGRGTSIAAGKYITDNIYVEIVTDAKGYTATQIEISLTKSLSLLSSVGGFGGSNGSLRYSKDF